MVAALDPVEPLVLPRRRRLAAVDARSLGGAVVVGLLIAAIEFSFTRRVVPLAFVDQFTWLLRLSMHWTLAVLPLGWLLGQLEQRTTRSVPSRLGYAAVLALGSIAGACIVVLHSEYVDPAISATAVGRDMGLVDRFLYGLWQIGFWGSIGVLLHAADLRRRRSVTALREVERAAVSGERSLAETQLAALHAQVEPEFVVATLDTVEGLYARDVEAADRVLDALILFLREATPLLRREFSTVERESRLLESYAQVLGAASGTAGSVSVDVATDVREVALPPGILVSLAKGILDDCFTRSAEFEVRARRSGDGVDVDLVANAHRIRHTQNLRDCIARAARRLESNHAASGSIAVLEEGPRQLALRLLVSLRGNHHVES